jgi:ABC-type multidrug transport system permease subunit
MVLICTFLMAKDIEHCFMCLFAACMSSLLNCLITSFAYSLNRLLVVGLSGTQL